MDDLCFESNSKLLQYSKDDLQKILANYGRDLTNISKDVDSILEWMKTQPHIPKPPSSRKIVYFLVMNKFSIERTKEKLEMNYSIRSLMPEYYKSLLPTSKDIIEIQGIVQMFYLPKLTKDLNRVLVLKIKDTNLDKFSASNYHRLYLLLCELRTIHDISSSDDFILDYSYATAGLFAKITPMDAKTFLTIMEKVYPNRINALHFVKLPSFAETFLALVKNFIKPKIRERVHTHKNYEDLLNFYNKEMLPSDFGGTESSLSELEVEWNCFLQKNTQHFQELDDLEVDLSLRPEKLKNDEILGFHGNFRKLQVD